MKTQDVVRGREALVHIIRKTLSLPLPAIVSISGITCSGKTTLAGLIASLAEKNGHSAVVVNLDDYYRDENDPLLPRDPSGNPVFDLPDAFHSKEFTRSIRSLAEEGVAFIPIYDKGPNRRSRFSRLAGPAKVIVAEGLFSNTFLRQADIPALSIYMETPLETCIERRVERDMTLFRVSEDRVRRMWNEKILPYLNLERSPEKECADIIVNP